MENLKKSPHKITVQISRAENLLIISEKKGKKPSKWRVLIMGHRKKIMTAYSVCPLGNPIWDCEMTLKLNKLQQDPIVFVVVDFSNNQVGQVVVPLVGIKSGTSLFGQKDSAAAWPCSELEPTRKCSQVTGCLYYRIWIDEYYPEEGGQYNGVKRPSIFGWKQESKPVQLKGGSQLHLSQSEKAKAPKRLSFFKSNDKSDHSRFKTGKAKSLANINYIETIEQSQSSDSDLDKKTGFPPDRVYDDVTEDLGWVRVGDVNGENEAPRRHSVITFSGEMERVEVWSVQPDNGPITGNFTVVMEGSNFSSGLFDLTYICIDGIEPIDATTCTEIVSDTELVLTMPPIQNPGMVTINLELLDGSMISCAKTFHYIDLSSEDTVCNVFTPRNCEFPDISSLDDVLDQYDDVVPSPKPQHKSRSSINDTVLKRDSGMGSFNDTIEESCERRKLSDYGSQGSIHSERLSSRRRKSRQLTLSKMELFEEVGMLRQEVASLQIQLKELATSTNTQIAALKCQLQSRDSEIDNISHSLCSLRVKLLEDGLTDYLELK